MAEQQQVPDFISDTAKGLPEAAASIYLNAATALIGSGTPADKASHIALRQVRHGGFYSTPTGWKQLGPDVRSKINIRQAVKQADGTYAVFGVPVFHPNATKGSEDEKLFTADRIRLAIKNTNDHIAAGGPPPGLTQGHPNPSQKAIGIEIPVWGKCVHFAESDRGPGWALCDIVDVAPAMYEAWKQGRYIGFSSGMVADANSLNLRFGHVAALGGDAQALPQLTYTEIYAADEQLVFAAEPILVPNQKGNTAMANYAALKSCHAAMSSAYASAEAGEPGWEKKLEEAQAGVQAATGEETPPAANPDEKADEALIEAKLKEKGMAAETPAEEVIKPKEEAPEYATQFSALQAENKQLRQAVAGLVGKNVLSEWTAYLTGLQAKGHQFDAAAATATFKAAYDSPAAIEGLKKMLEASPVSTLTTPGATFGAEGGRPIGSELAITPENVLKVLREHGNMNRTFTAEDVKFGEVVTRK